LHGIAACGCGDENPIGETMNQQRLQTIIDRVEKHPETFDQTKWGYFFGYIDCKTAYCIAGHAMRDAGETGDPEKAARKWLELTAAEATWLFDSFRKLKDIKYFCKHGKKPKKEKS